ncbi:serine hydrolase domain-containing protein [Oceanicaulis alexandrii]|uniref:serine hydrolase domain-containing protein n=1 Tax=Oceanicaulis alexandrii TaxID=153233 RepID=UPI0035CF4D01
MRVSNLVAGAALALLSPMVFAQAQTPEAAAERMQDFLSGFEDLGPGYAVVAVTADDVLLREVWGERRASTGAPLTADTPIYIASQTKAFMGLLAAQLDAEGVLSLDTTLADHWPGVRFPEGVNPSDWTLRDLISHQVPVSADLIVILEAYVTRIDPADYPRLIEAVMTAREPGFDYDNLGYNLYGAILETVTGRTWQDWLEERVFDPLDLEHTSARTSDFALDAQSWNHIWTGSETGWFEVRPKTDAQMQSAGGITTSPNDMIAWLQMNLRGEGPAGSGLTEAIVSEAHTIAAEVSREARNAYELPCYGYTLGWNVCDFEGHTLYAHGGGYTGARTMMAFSPDLGVGIGVFSNSDNMTGWLTSRTMIQFLQFVIDHEDADRWSARRQELYPQRIERSLSGRLERVANGRDNPVYGDWSWAPETSELSVYEGVYSSEAMYAPVTVSVVAGQLQAAWGDYRFTGAPAQTDVFGLQQHPLDEVLPLQFERDEAGEIVALSYEKARFERR